MIEPPGRALIARRTAGFERWIVPFRDCLVKRIRSTTARATALPEPHTSAATHQMLMSFPALSECMKASGHDAYASQCTVRHHRCPSRLRTKLVIRTAAPRSTAKVPRLNASGL